MCNMKDITLIEDKMSNCNKNRKGDCTVGRNNSDVEKMSHTLTSLNLDNIPNSEVNLQSTTTQDETKLCSTTTELKISTPHKMQPFGSICTDSDKGESEDEHSQYQAIVSSNCQDVKLTRERPTTLSLSTNAGKRRLLKVGPNDISSPDSPLSDDDIDILLSTETDSQDDTERSIIQQLDNEVEKIPELTLQEERTDMKSWKTCVIGGLKRKIDMRVIEPYKRVLSHGGYLTAGSCNAIITFSACYLPHKSRVDYNYVMDNLFLYVLSTLNQLVTDDYLLVYLHGGTAKDCMPTFSWLKRCYQMIDRKLKKNLKSLYLVHPTFWLKTLVIMLKPFISSKFSRKMQFVNSLAELQEILPIEGASIPDRVKQYDRIKLSYA